MSAPTPRAKIARTLPCTLAGVAVVSLVSVAITACRRGEAPAGPTSTRARTTTETSAPTTVPTPPAAARELVTQELDATLGAGNHELLLVVAEGSAAASIHRATDAVGPYEALTTYRIGEDGRLTGAAMYRTTQNLGRGPVTQTYTSTGTIDPAAIEANRQLVQTMYHEVVDLRRPEAPGRYIAEGYIQHNPVVSQGRAGIEGLVTALGPAPEGASYRREELVIADGDFVLLVSSFGAGGPRIADLFRVESAMVAEHWDFLPVR